MVEVDAYEVVVVNIKAALDFLDLGLQEVVHDVCDILDDLLSATESKGVTYIDR